MNGMSHISICNVAVGGVSQLHTEQTTALLSLLSAIIVHRLVLHLSTHLVCCLLPPCCTLNILISASSDADLHNDCVYFEELPQSPI